MPNISAGSKFYFFNGATATQIYGMLTRPAMRSLPQRVDATSVEDLETTDVAGVKQTGDRSIPFKRETVGGTVNYDTFLLLEGVTTKFGIAYPDGSALEWYAKPYIQRDQAGVNELEKFTVHFFENTSPVSVSAPVLATPVGVLGTLGVSTAAGTTGKSIITVAPNAIEGFPYVYKTKMGSAESVTYDQDLSPWTPLVSGQSITVTNGYYVTVAAINAQYKARRAGNAVCVSGA